MSRFKISIFILIFIIILILSWIFALTMIKDDIISTANRALESADENDRASVEKETKHLVDTWASYRYFLTLFIKHESIDEITLSMISLSPLLDGEDLSHFKAECLIIIETVNHLWLSEIPTLNHIF